MNAPTIPAERRTVLRTFACAMLAISLGGALHRSQGMEWHPSLQVSWGIAAAAIHLLATRAMQVRGATSRQ